MNAIRCLILLMATLMVAPPANAHRLDEYLQATRIDISSNRVDLEMDLTPGVAVAGSVLPLMDTNHDGRISPKEGDAYARLILKSVLLEVDHKRQAVKLGGADYPSVIEMETGMGVIRLKASAEFASVIPGPHQLHFQNTNQTNISVYLINAYVPKSSTIRITHQSRDLRQTEIQIDYTFTTAGVTKPSSAAREPSASVRPHQ